MAQSTIQLFDVQGRRKYLTNSERFSFEESCHSQPESRRLFCLIMFYTGCRISEALALTRLRIDVEESFVVFITLKQNKDKETSPMQRAVPIPPWLAEELSSHFFSKEGKLWSFSRTTGWRIIKEVMTSVQIHGVHATPRGLRHSFAISNLQAGVPINFVSEAMGHTSLETTKIYLNAVGKERMEFFARAWPPRNKNKIKP